MAKIIDLSMTVHDDMVTFEGVPQPKIVEKESHEEYATNVGANEYGITSLTAHYEVTVSDHAGTHIDSLYHIVPDGPSVEEIPLDYCYGDGVLLDFSEKPAGYVISEEDIKQKLEEIDYQIKPLDIVLIQTGASRYNDEKRYLVEHCGMSRDSTLWLINQGVKVMGIDAPTFDPPVKTMFEEEKFWEAHRVMNEEEYYHLENMENFDALPEPYGFKISVLPIKWKGVTGAPVRAVAIIED